MGQIGPMAVELVDRLAILVIVRRFHSMRAHDSRSLRSDNYVRMKKFVRRSTFPFRRFWVMCAGSSCNAFPLFFVATWVPIAVTLYKRREVLML
jgi:hypothetical protein